MKCREANELFVAYLDGEVTSSERTLIRAHLAECDCCRKELAALSKTQDRVRQSLYVRAAQSTPSPQAWNRLQTRLARQTRPSQLWLQRLAPSVWRLIEKNLLAMKGEMTMSRKVVWVVVAIVALISAAFFTYPPMQTLAQDILGRFRSVIITDAPTAVERVRVRAPTPVGRPTATPIVTPPRILTVQEASQEAGFEILDPAYLPAGYQLVARGVHHAEAGVSVSTMYAMVGTTYDPAYGMGEGTPTLSLFQIRYAPDLTVEHPVGDAPTTEVTVRGQSGLWVEQAAMGCCDEHGNVFFRNLLVWQEDDIFIDLRSDDLPVEEMLRIAESLSP